MYIFLQLHQYQYYSTGLLSTHDPFYEQQRHLLGPKKKKIKDEKKFKGKDKEGISVSVGVVIMSSKKNWIITGIDDKISMYHLHAIFFFIAKLKKVKKKKKRGEGDFLDEGRPYVTKVFAKFSHDAPLPMVKKKHLTIEQMNARRRKVWLTIAKKEIPKVSMRAD